MTPLFPNGAKAQADAIKVSTGIVSHGHVFLTGVTGSLADGTMPMDAEAQFRSAFDKIGAVRSEYVRAPFPAWTALEVAGLPRAGALVEIRVLAALSVDLEP